MQPPDAMFCAAQTLHTALATATLALKRAGIEHAGNDARQLLAAALGMSSAQVLAAPEMPLTAAHAATFARFLARRAGREPVSRILGERAFYGRAFKLSPATLDPRPDSETLIEVALACIDRAGPRTAPITVLDVGTGSGCLLATLLAELPNATGLGTDLSKAALQTAAENANRLGVASRASWKIADALERIDGPFDILLCNPPYVRSDALADLDPEVRDFDPRTALDGGSDGLVMYRRMAPRVPIVVPRGWAFFEVGYDQAEAVADLLASVTNAKDSPRPSLHTDVAGKRRCVAWKTRA